MLRTRTAKQTRRLNTIMGLSVKSPKSANVDHIIKRLMNLLNDLGVTSKHFSTKSRASLKGIGNIGEKKIHGAIVGELLTVWHQDPIYLDASGNPAPLRMSASKRSFKKLVEKATPNIDPSRLLAQLMQVGAVTMDENKFIHAKMRSLSVYEDTQLAILHTLSSLDSFIKTLHHNLVSASSNSNQQFHRIASNADFPLEDIPSLKIWVKRHGQNFLESSDNWMMRKARYPKQKSTNKNHFAQTSVGVYLTIEGVSEDQN